MEDVYEDRGILYHASTAGWGLTTYAAFGADEDLHCGRHDW